MSTLIVNGFPLGIDGRVAVTTQLPASDDYYFEGRRYRKADGVIRAALNNAPAAWIGGVGFNSFSQMCITALGTFAASVDGLSFDTGEQLFVDPTSPIDHYMNGWPMTAAGRLCITDYEAGLHPIAFTLGFTSGFY